MASVRVWVPSFANAFSRCVRIVVGDTKSFRRDLAVREACAHAVEHLELPRREAEGAVAIAYGLSEGDGPQERRPDESEKGAFALAERSPGVVREVDHELRRTGEPTGARHFRLRLDVHFATPLVVRRRCVARRSRSRRR